MKHQLLFAIGATVVAVGITGCGKGSSLLEAPLPVNADLFGNQTANNNNNNENGNNNYPPYEYRVGAVGYTPTTIRVLTNKILKVRFAPGVQDEFVAGTGFSPEYTKLGVYIHVGDTAQERATPFLDNGKISGNVQHADMDFSNTFVRTCPSNDNSCRQEVIITVYKPNYDYWCINFGISCPKTVVHSTHPWNGTLKVITDDTAQSF